MGTTRRPIHATRQPGGPGCLFWGDGVDGYWLGGVSTVSIMYTVAFAVCTPPHTKPASLTLRPFPWPVTFTSAPCSVLRAPSTLLGLSCPCTTWKVRMFFNMSALVLSSSIVLAGSLSNAALVGANPVY